MGHRTQSSCSLPEFEAHSLESKLPALIEKAVATQVEALAGEFKKEIEGTQTRVLETFVKDVQEKLTDRIAAIETGMTGYADEMKQLRGSAVRTDENLTRLLSSIDKLTQGLPPSPAETLPQLPAPRSDEEGSRVSLIAVPLTHPPKRKAKSRNLPAIAFWAVVLILALAVSARLLRKPHHPVQAASDSAAPAVPAAADSSLSKSPFVSNFSGTVSVTTVPLTGAEIK
jgi:hypothetical protein